jgi:hypothetical protein
MLSFLLPDTAGATEQIIDNAPVKFALYSSAWGENARAGLRLVVENQQDVPIRLQSIEFSGDEGTRDAPALALDLAVPAGGFAEAELPYIDLLTPLPCVTTTMADNWRLVEISNYTLNPSVRSLIIEDTDAFRIYQCITSATTGWLDTTTNEVHQYREWVLYHFERRLDR